MEILKRIKSSNILFAILIVIIIASFKLAFQYFGIEFLTVNPLLTAIISGNIFILGFLLNSTLRDYKEAEKFPGEIAASLETIYDECEILYSQKPEPIVMQCIEHIQSLNILFPKWFRKEAYTQQVLYELSEFNQFWGKFEPLTQANFIVRLKNEQNNLRKMLIRVNIIRDTPFYEASYKIAKLSVIFMLILLTLLHSNPFYEYLFFICMIAFLNVFLVMLIKDLDDPFEYSNTDSKDEVSLKSFLDLENRINKRSTHLNKSK
jgi:hypothetical protein